MSVLVFFPFYIKLFCVFLLILLVSLATSLVIVTSFFKLNPILKTLISHGEYCKNQGWGPSDIDTKPHRKWDKTYNRKIIPKFINNQSTNTPNYT